MLERCLASVTLLTEQCSARSWLFWGLLYWNRRFMMLVTSPFVDGREVFRILNKRLLRRFPDEPTDGPELMHRTF